MKAFIFNKDNEDKALEVKKVHFTEVNRERLRKHIQKQTGLHFVWFEDEDPPPEVMEVIQKAADSYEESDEEDYDEETS